MIHGHIDSRSVRSRLLRPPDGSFFLLGPRGTGKTLWTNVTFPDALRIDLLDPGEFRSLAAFPERLISRVTSLPQGSKVVIDEVQKLPSLLEVVQFLIASRPDVQFVLTGSSARKLRRGNVNLLGGRALQVHMHPYVASELRESFDLDEALHVGLVPVVFEAPQPEQTLQSYVNLYIREEVFAEGLVRNTEHFSRFLEVLSFSHGEILNISNIARDASIQRKTIENYVDILEDLLLGFRLPVFTHHAKRETIRHPKFYFFDAGVYQAIRPRGPLDNQGSILGHALEGLVAQHLRALCDLAGDGRKLFYWHTRSGSEVDFVVYGPTMFVAIEVKMSTSFRSEDLRSLRTFAKDYPEARCTLLYRGTEMHTVDNIRVVPLNHWIREFATTGLY